MLRGLISQIVTEFFFPHCSLNRIEEPGNKTMKQFFAIVILIIGISALACSRAQSARSEEAANRASDVSQPSTQEIKSAAEKPVCTLTLAGAPDIKGLRLGMTPEQVLAIFPGSDQDVELRATLAMPPSKFGVSGFVIRPEKYQSKEIFSGITQITFTLLDGRVSSFSAGYNGPEYSHVDKFVAKVIEGTNLPAANAWEGYVGMDTQLKMLKCAEVEIRAFVGGPGGNLNYVLMNDLVAAKKLKDRKDKANAAERP
ncbi:MAG: hypothetical protein QOE96_3019 [Blastocatellia bacterium]|nr:hypothetical protein [Blastocatellia bacterium]